MKVVKLDRRWRQYRENNHTMGIRFDHWTKEASNIESVLKTLTGTHGWDKNSPWYSYYGKAPNKSTSRPYYITLRDESLVSVVLLTVGA